MSALTTSRIARSAAVVAMVMLLISFALILGVNLVQARARARFGDV